MTSRAFTLLEVMVAVAILGLALTVIVSAQSGLYSGSTYARHVSVATGLARCKMSEVEERLLRLGYPELDEVDEGACCDEEGIQGFACKWKIERVELPGVDTAAVMGDGGAGPLGALMGIAANPQAIGGADGGLSAVASDLQQTTGGAAGLAQLAMSMAYPRLKPMLEASIRKVTVRVGWKDGKQDRDLTIVQYVTYPQRGGLGLPQPTAAGDAGTTVPFPRPRPSVFGGVGR